MTRGVAGYACPGALLICLLALGLSSGVAQGYDYYITPAFYELPFVTTLPHGARSIGMGGAGLAVVDDASAAVVNPAGLARLRRIELAAGLSRTATSLGGEAFGSGFDTDLTGTDLTSFRAAYPFPTFRGSLVLAVSAERIYDFDEDFLATYRDSFAGTAGNIVDQAEALEANGGITSWNLAAAFEASENVALGATVSYLSGSYDRRFAWVADPDDVPIGYQGTVGYSSDASSDASGFRATVGGLFYVNESVATALVVQSPVTVTFTGTKAEVFEWPDGSREEQLVSFEDEVSLPFSFAAGVAYMPTDLIVLAGDLRYTDWSEVDYAGRVFLENGDGDELISTRRYAYEEVLDVMLGAEVIIPTWPLRLRAGYAMRPLSYQGLEVDQEQSYFTLGAGVLIDTVFSIDVAWMGGSFERSGEDFDYRETEETNAIIVEAIYRF